ncbi:hypothetical protein OG264_25885 [Streptomyces xanthophaeus]|nr:hypothetical protein OG264_25885 [Streptomyces xanthophaeus]WST60396.1 hypothetical protein OG605_12560 [Streptomyces xanthophaeus]
MPRMKHSGKPDTASSDGHRDKPPNATPPPRTPPANPQTPPKTK